MVDVCLLLGSNENDRLNNLETAKQLIELRSGKIEKQSPVYETEAWGLKEQNSFLNQAVLVNTKLAALDLLHELKAIEKEVGRKETVKWGPRVIDIDILFYDDEIIEEEDLKVPHPYIHERKFTLVPLNEIATQLVHPVLKKTVQQLLQECKDGSEVKNFPTQPKP